MGCIEHLPVCGAACCKAITFKVKQRPLMRAGCMSFTVPDLNEDLRWYYALHGCSVQHDSVIVNITGYKWNRDKKQVIINARCRALTPENKCSLHPNKPAVCKSFTRETAYDGGYYIPEKCLFRRDKL